MSRIRICGGNYTKITQGKHLIHSEDSIEFNSLKKIYEEGEQNGVLHGDFEERQVNNDEYIVSGEWLDKDGKPIDSSKSPHAKIGEKVYFRVKTQNLPINSPISFELMEYDGSLLLPLLGGKMIEVRPFDDYVPFFETNNTGNQKVMGFVDEKGEIVFGVTLTEDLSPFIDEDKGAFIELYFRCKYEGQKREVKLLPTSTDNYLEVGNSDRTIYIKPVSEKYKLPEFIDSLGNFVVFLANESGDMVGDFNSTIGHFYTVKVRVMNEYTYHSNFNTVTKRIYEEKYNVNTGLDSHLNLYEETEKVEFRIKKDAQQIFKESDTTETIKKQIKDYYNVNDLSKMGLKGVQKTLNILGYLDYWNDLQGIAKGEKPKIYDAVGVITTTAEIAAKAAGTTLEIPIWANAVLFGLAVFEETIVADAIRDMDEFVENAMMTDLENAKLKGFFGVRRLFETNDYFSEKKYNYRLVRSVPQEIVDEIFKGKRRKFNSIEIDMGKYFNTVQRYDLIFKIMPENEKTSEMRYSLETILTN